MKAQGAPRDEIVDSYALKQTYESEKLIFNSWYQQIVLSPDMIRRKITASKEQSLLSL